MIQLLFSRINVFFFIFLSCFCSLSAEENFILINGLTDEIVVEQGSQINNRISPCSSFKMTLSLMGYDSGILKDEKTPQWNYHEGYDDFLEVWKAPQTPESWMQYSCVWYAKLLAQQLGLDKIQNYLIAFDYGNKDMSGGLPKPGSIAPAWVNSSLKVSPKEQAEYIAKMLQGDLPISTHAVQMTKNIAFKEELSTGWKLFGKTGWSGSDIAKDGKTSEHAWFVGWIEKDHNFYSFAYLIQDKKINLKERIPRVKQLLIESGIMN